MKIIFLFLILVYFVSCAGSVPDSIGIRNNKLAECPDSPNCVSSQSEKESHFMTSWKYKDSMDLVYNEMIEFFKKKNDVKIIETRKNYIWLTFTIPVMGFVDDVEFYFPENEKVIHFRSASRVGYSDLGVNKNRMNQLKKDLHLLFD